MFDGFLVNFVIRFTIHSLKFHFNMLPNYSLTHPRYEKMTYNRCGNSGLLLPAISLGLWHNFGFVDSIENGRNILRTAFDSGITHFDLANNYGPPAGSAEENFGTMLKHDFATHRDELIISTKAGYAMWTGPYGEWGSKKYLVSSLDQSLKRMQLDYVDIFYSHRPDPWTPLEETMATLDLIVRQGKALYVGISNYSAADTKRAAEMLRNMGTPCLIHQPKYSMFVREPEGELFAEIERQGMGCIAFSPLAQGLLTNRYLKGIPADSRAAKPHGFLQQEQVSEFAIEKVKKLNEIAQQRQQSMAQMALAWVLRDRRVTSVLIGASSVEQLNVNLGTLNTLSFTNDELQHIDHILNS